MLLGNHPEVIDKRVIVLEHSLRDVREVKEHFSDNIHFLLYYLSLVFIYLSKRVF